MPFIANTDADRAHMLGAIGVGKMEDLFADFPADKRYPAIDLPPAMSEIEVIEELGALAARNESAHDLDWFLGAGCYNHFVPAVVGSLASRGEFVTAYTPYQPEVSQGTLQAIFEYQSMIAGLTGMDAVNASHYDGATALAEAVLMSWNSDRQRSAIHVPANLHPEYLEVLKTYFCAFPVTFVQYKGSAREAAAALGADAACLVAQWPDFTGELEDLSGVGESVHAAGAHFIVHADPVMLGLFKAPSAFGADVVTAEGQSLGNAMNYGGPGLGIMATTGKLVRKMPGRIVGEAKDHDGRRGFVLTLVAREQHIRREKAVSNICSNQGLATLQACIHLAAMGKAGMRKVAETCWHRAHYAAQEIAKIPGYSLANGQFFKEFTVRTPIAAETISERLFAKGIVPGLPLSRYYPERKNELLVCVTEMNSKAKIDRLVAALKEVSK